jgi:hypothetical protein
MIYIWFYLQGLVGKAWAGGTHVITDNLDEELLCPEFELDLSSIFSTLVFFTLAQVFNPLC